jgi:signal transduction histidine kinase
MEPDHPQLLRQQTILAQFGELALRSDSLDEILTEACRLVGEALGTHFAKVVELQADGKTLLVRAGVGWKDGVVGVATINAEADTSEAYALKTGEPMISPDIEKETRFRYPQFLIDNGAKAVANVIIIGGKDRPPFGILQVDSRTPREFTDSDITFLRGYANLLAATVDRHRVLDEMRDSATRLRLALEAGELGSFELDVADRRDDAVAPLRSHLWLCNAAPRLVAGRYAGPCRARGPRAGRRSNEGRRHPRGRTPDRGPHRARQRRGDPLDRTARESRRRGEPLRSRHRGGRRHHRAQAGRAGDLATNERLEAQVEERMAELRLHRDIVQSDRSLIVAFDQDYRVTVFNQAHGDEFFRVFGRQAQLGEVLPDLFPPDQAAVLRGFLDRALAGESFTVVEEFGDPEREKLPFEVSYYPLKDEAGRIIGAFHHARIIADRLRAEAELAEAQEQLRQSQKMEAVGQLTGGLAHDFNNLLAGISGSLELMAKRISQRRFEDVVRYLVAAQAAARRAAALTHRLLAFSRRQTLAPKVTDVNHLVTGMEELIRRTVGPEVVVASMTGSGVWSVEIDPNQLENALLNLAINARDAMPDGGRLTIETANDQMDARPAGKQELSPGQYVSLSRERHRQRHVRPSYIAGFDPFFTTKPLGWAPASGSPWLWLRPASRGAGAHHSMWAGHDGLPYLPRHREAEGRPPRTRGTGSAPAQAGETVCL